MRSGRALFWTDSNHTHTPHNHHMKKRTLTLLLGSLALLSVSAFTVINSNGSQVGDTNSPPDAGPYDCTNCHHGGTATPVPTFTAVPAFGSGMTYLPGTTYTISFAVTGYPGFGFDVEMLNGNTATSTAAGTFTAVGTNVLVHAASTYPINLTHSTPIHTGSVGSFKWVSPAAGGTVYVYAAYNGVNLDGNTTGDKGIDKTYTLVVSPTAVPEIAASNVSFNMFPNPASDHLNLTYTLAKTSVVSIQIYSMQGKLVSNLLTQTLEAGEQTYNADLPESLAKGIYNLSLTVDGVVTMKKLMIH